MRAPDVAGYTSRPGVCGCGSNVGHRVLSCLMQASILIDVPIWHCARTLQKAKRLEEYISNNLLPYQKEVRHLIHVYSLCAPHHNTRERCSGC